MLETLDTVDWGSLRHAYGSAEGTPRDLRRLLAAEAPAREEAGYQLAMSLVHQGSLCPAAAAAVPFLTEIVASPETPDTALVLELLTDLAWGSVDSLAQVEEFGESVTAEGYLADGSGPWGPPLKRLVHQRLGERLAVYLALLQAPCFRTRLHAAALLCALPEHAAAVAPVLARSLETETDETVRTHAIWVLRRLAGEAQRELFLRLVATEAPGLSRLAALGACVAVLGEAAPPATAEELLGLLAETLPNADLVRRYDRLPSTTEVLSDLALPLSRLGPDWGARVLPLMLAALESGVCRALTAQGALLLVALGTGNTPLVPETLTEVQLRAVRAVAAQVFPSARTTYGAGAAALQSHGLPGTYREMQAFLGAALRASRQGRPWWRLR